MARTMTMKKTMARTMTMKKAMARTMKMEEDDGEDGDDEEQDGEDGKKEQDAAEERFGRRERTIGGRSERDFTGVWKRRKRGTEGGEGEGDLRHGRDLAPP
jgi:hypothetical protein